MKGGSQWQHHADDAEDADDADDAHDADDADDAEDADDADDADDAEDADTVHQLLIPPSGTSLLTLKEKETFRSGGMDVKIHRQIPKFPCIKYLVPFFLQIHL